MLLKINKTSVVLAGPVPRTRRTRQSSRAAKCRGDKLSHQRVFNDVNNQRGGGGGHRASSLPRAPNTHAPALCISSSSYVESLLFNAWQTPDFNKIQLTVLKKTKRNIVLFCHKV